MSHFFLYFFYLFLIVSPCLSTETTQDNNLFFFWKGFDHQWLRHVVEVFETPHRMGEIANYILPSTNSGSGNSPLGNVTFTPGVNGDFAHPSLKYSVHNLTANSASSSDLVLSDYDAHFSFRDHAHKDENGVIHATNQFVKKFSIPLGRSSLSLDSSDAFLQGFRIDMHCNSSAQPQGEVCNSNGVWPYKFHVGLDNCQLEKNPNNTVLQCFINFTLFRGWTPAFGGGKAFNFVMDYTVHIYLTIINGPFTLSIPQFPVVRESSIQAPPVNGSAMIRGVQQTTETMATTVLRSFGFDLPITDNFAQQGRYMERLVFHVQDNSYDREQATMTYDYVMGYSAPLSVFPSKVIYHHTPALLQVDATSMGTLSEFSSSSGTVCINDKSTLFNCALHGLKSQTTTTIKLSL